tara:strand:+ start:2092 stop:2484 length:393 start_codon:yes stop_codon:yes gene_type:complete
MDGHEFPQDTAMIPSQIDNLSLFALYFFKNNHADKSAIVLAPYAFATFQTPGIENITVQNESFAMSMFQELRNFLGFAVSHAQMNIQKNDRFRLQDRFFHRIVNKLAISSACGPSWQASIPVALEIRLLT